MAYVGTAEKTGNDLYTIASILEGEAGGEGPKGMQAVANVIANRASQNFGEYGDNPIAQATAKMQFQGQGQAKPSTQAITIAAKMLAGQLPDITQGALYYANPGDSSAHWARGLNSNNSVKIGSQYFTDNVDGHPFQAGDASPQSNESTYDRVSKQAAAQLPPNQISALLAAYSNHQMSPEDAKQFEADVHNGLVVVPQNVKIGGDPEAATANNVELPQSVIDAYNLGAIDPYNVKAMGEADRHQLDDDLKSGLVHVPSGATLNQSYMSTIGKLKEKFTGEKHLEGATFAGAPTKDLPDYSTMPEMNDLTSWASWLATLGSQTGGPEDIATAIKHNFPDVKVLNDDHNNIVLQSSDGKQYLITPGATANDILRAITVGSLFGKATGGASTIAGATVRGGAAETALQGVNALAGGREVDPMAVGTSAALSGAVPVLGSLVKGLVPETAARIGLGAREASAAPKPGEVPTGGAPAAGEAPRPSVATPAAEAPKAAPATPEAAPTPTTPAVPTTSPAAQAAPGKLDEAAFKDLIEKTSKGDETAKAQLLQALNVNQDVLKAGKQLGVEEHLTVPQVSGDPTARAVTQGLQKSSVEGRQAETKALKGIEYRRGQSHYEARGYKRSCWRE